MRPALRALALLSLAVLIQSCSRDDKPTFPNAPVIPGFNSDASLGISACPAASDVTLSVNRGSLVFFQLLGSDPDGDALDFNITQPPARGTLTLLASPGVGIYTAGPTYCGPDRFKFTVSDGTCTSAEATVFITITGCNQCPVAGDIDVSVDQDGTVNFQLLGSDADLDVIVYSITQPPAHGFLVAQTHTGDATYTPVAGYIGPDSFKYDVSDDGCTSPEATVSINVGPQQPPDGDGDGVPDAEDDCPDSDLRESVWVGDCDTGVPNLIDGAIVNADGCSLADLIHHQLEEAAANADNHGRLVSAMTRSLHTLVADGLIARNQVGAIMRCVAQADFELQ